MILRRCAKTILLKNVYCAKSNPEPDSQSGSRVHKGLETRALCSIWECTLVTAIAIWTLTQPLTCKIGSSIFAAMSRLKVASTTCASLPIIPSTDRTNKEKKLFSWQCRPCLSFFNCSHPEKACPFPISYRTPSQNLQI